ncbi:MAG: hypothetical protein QXP83_07855 [Candidatus Nezhaarchaeales archaeon]
MSRSAFAPKKRKFAQLVWIEPAEMIKLWKISDETGHAVNTIISNIVKEYLKGEAKPVEKVVEKVVPRAYVCPGCFKSFAAFKEVVEHLDACPDIRKIVEERSR